MGASWRRRRAPAGEERAPGKIEARLGAAIDKLYAGLERSRVTRFPWAVIQIFSNAQGALLSGSMAYYTFLSLLPLLLVVGSVIGFLSSIDVDLRLDLMSALDDVFPQGYGSVIVNQLIDSRAAFGLFGFVALAYGASGFVGSLTACLNRMWEVEGGRNPVGQKVVNLGIVALLGAALLASAALTVWVNSLASLIVGAEAGTTAQIVDLLLGPVVLFLVLLVIYRLLPARALTWRSQIPGAIFGAIGIEVIKRIFALWAERSAGVSVLPRSLLSAVLLLVWLGFFGQLVLYGAALNVELDRRRKEGSGPDDVDAHGTDSDDADAGCVNDPK
jgi:membrane protein